MQRSIGYNGRYERDISSKTRLYSMQRSIGYNGRYERDI